MWSLSADFFYRSTHLIFNQLDFFHFALNELFDQNVPLSQQFTFHPWRLPVHFEEQFFFLGRIRDKFSIFLFFYFSRACFRLKIKIFSILKCHKFCHSILKCHKFCHKCHKCHKFYLPTSIRVLNPQSDEIRELVFWKMDGIKKN